MPEKQSVNEKKVNFSSSMFPTLQMEFKKACAKNGEQITDVLDRLVREYVENSHDKGVDD